MKLRTRFLIATSVIVFLTVSVLSVAIYATVSKHLLSEVDNTLDARVVAIAESIRPRNKKHCCQFALILSLKLLILVAM
jgi:hypothetical protein